MRKAALQAVMDNEPLILSINTATLPVSVAVTHGGVLLADRVGAHQKSSSVTLLGEVADTIQAAGIDRRSISLFAAACGPGSFTGLRTGLALIKGLAATLRRPCVGVPTLHAVARSEAIAEKQTVVLLPAGRGEVYAQFLILDSEAAVREVSKPMHVAPAKLFDSVCHMADLCWSGDGARALMADIAERAARCNIEFTLAAENKSPHGYRGWTVTEASGTLAEHVADLARRAYQLNEAVRADQLKALYVRPSDAELSKPCPNRSLAPERS